MIGHAEEWHFLIPGVQLRFNDFHCLELRGGSGEVMQRGVCHLNLRELISDLRVSVGIIIRNMDKTCFSEVQNLSK